MPSRIPPAAHSVRETAKLHSRAYRGPWSFGAEASLQGPSGLRLALVVTRVMSINVCTRVGAPSSAAGAGLCPAGGSRRQKRWKGGLEGAAPETVAEPWPLARRGLGGERGGPLRLSAGRRRRGGCLLATSRPQRR